MKKKRYVVRAVQESMVETTVEAGSPVEAILLAEEHGTKWKPSVGSERRVRYIITSSRPEGA